MARAALGFLALLWACAPASSPAPVAGAAAEPDQIILDFTMDSYAGVQRVWTLRAPRARMFDGQHRVDIETPRLRFFDKGKPGSIVEAENGQLDTATRDLYAGGGVVLKSTEGSTLTSPWMRYDSKTDRLVSTAPVVITRGNSRVQGVGWQATTDMSSVEILNQRGVIAGEDVEGFRNK